MQLNPNDYNYEIFRQNRGEGDSKTIYKGKPKRKGLATILVKDIDRQTAINEFLGCNIGQYINVNTPRAWLFRQDIEPIDPRISFEHAVAIEFLDGFIPFPDKNNCDGNKEQKHQWLKCLFLHTMMNETDKYDCAFCNGKVYAFDFQSSLYPYGNKIEAYMYAWRKLGEACKGPNGFSEYEWYMLGREIFARKGTNIEIKLQTEKYGDLIPDAFMEFREDFMRAYNKSEGFKELVSEIGDVFLPENAIFVEDLLGRMQQAIVCPF